MHYPLSEARGFTLIEAMITVLIVAIIASIGAPSLRAFMEKNQIKAETQRVAAMFTLARNQAVTDNQAVIIFRQAVNGALNVDICIDGNSDNNCGDTTDTYIERSPGAETSLYYGAGNRVFADNAVAINAHGRLGEAGPGILTICNHDKTAGRQIRINAIGRTRVSEITNPAIDCL